MTKRTNKPKRCPKCGKMTLYKGSQTTLYGKEIQFIYCSRASCGYQEPPLTLKF